MRNVFSSSSRVHREVMIAGVCGGLVSRSWAVAARGSTTNLSPDAGLLAAAHSSNGSPGTFHNGVSDGSH